MPIVNGPMMGRLGIFFLLLTSSLFAQPQTSNYSFAPTQGLAGKALHVQVSAQPDPFSCASTYPEKKVTVEGNKITLRYIHEVDPLIDCIAIFDPLMMFGPNFEIPVLEAGSYDVYLHETFACLQATPACMIPERLEKIGVLKLFEGDDYDNSFWALNPVNPDAETDFSLQLLNPSKGNCNDYFTNQSVVEQFGYIGLTFVSRIQDPLLTCIVDIHPHGPEFEMQGLGEGFYNVMITDLPPCAACLPGEEPCAICDIYVAPTYLTRLKVGDPEEPTSMELESNHPVHQIKVARKGRVITLSGLPKVLQEAQIELLNSRGQVINSQITSPKNEDVKINLNAALPVGVYHIQFSHNPSHNHSTNQSTHRSIIGALPLHVLH